MERRLIFIFVAIILTVITANAAKTCPDCGSTYPDDCNFCEMCVTPTRLEGGGTTAGLPAGMTMVSIPGGKFSMGSKEGDQDEKPVHKVTIDGFKLSETEVTWEQYTEFLNDAQPSASKQKRWIRVRGESRGSSVTGLVTGHNSHIYYSGGKYYVEAGWEDHPASEVSWIGAKAFCDYYGLRLPTEAEWEYAAGGPEHYKYPWGNEFDRNACCGNWKYDSGLMPVKSFRPNGYGLYDMAGNVWEWCADWYDSDYYENSPNINPPGPTGGSRRVLRGGSAYDGEDYVRCASRLGVFDPAQDIYYWGRAGFRAAAEAGTETVEGGVETVGSNAETVEGDDFEWSAVPVEITLGPPPDTIENGVYVSKGNHTVTLFEDGELVTQYPCAAGRDGCTPEGTYTVNMKLVDPVWYWKGEAIPPGPENGLGSRFIGITSDEYPKGYGIHGTNEPGSIGRDASHGCVRMHNEDVEELFEMVEYGDTVVVGP